MAQEQGFAFELENHFAFVELVSQTMAHLGVQQPEHLQQSHFLNSALAPAGYHRPVEMTPSGLAAAGPVEMARQPSEWRPTID
jgi:hypothetical protein